jgi:transcriptional regulator with XRE-family HTH domain
MGKARKDRRADLTPEQQAKIEAIRKASRTPEARDRHAAIRARYRDKPGLKELIERGEVAPDRITTQGAVIGLHKALAKLMQIRKAKGLSLTEVAKGSGLAAPALSRLESGRQATFTFETLARYAAGVGMDLEITVQCRPAENDDLVSGSELPMQSALEAELTKLVKVSAKRLEGFLKPNQDIQPSGRKYGARVYLNQDGVVNVKQTIKRGRSQNDPYVVDRDRERFIDPGNDDELAAAVKEALNGRL